MKLTCATGALLTACQQVSAAVAARSTKPILSNIKATAHDDALTLLANDLEVGIRYELRGIEVQRAGSAILPIAKLISILRESGGSAITLDADENRTLARCGPRYELPGYPIDEFPELPQFDDGGRYHEVSAGLLRTMIRRTAFAADKKDSTKFALSGVLWEADAQALRLVATDSKRLAYCEAAVATHGADDAPKGGHLVPAKTMGLLEKNLTDDGELVKIVLKPNDALFRLDRATIYSRLVEGRYPPYRDIIPKKSAIKLPLPAAGFQTAIRQAAIMTDEETKRVDFTFEPEKVTLQAHGQATGSSEVEFPLPEFTGPSVKVSFDPQYLLDMLRAIEGEPTVQLEMTDGTKPVLFRVGENYLYLVMPISH